MLRCAKPKIYNDLNNVRYAFNSNLIAPGVSSLKACKPFGWTAYTCGPTRLKGWPQMWKIHYLLDFIKYSTRPIMIKFNLSQLDLVHCYPTIQLLASAFCYHQGQWHRNEELIHQITMLFMLHLICLLHSRLIKIHPIGFIFYPCRFSIFPYVW